MSPPIYNGGGGSGSTGPTGPRGPAGQSVVTTLVADFVVPNVGADVVITVLDASWAIVGESVYIGGAGSYVVDGIGSGVMNVRNTGATGNAAPGATVPATGQLTTASGLPGANGSTGSTGGTGPSGIDAFTTTTVNFNQPNVNATVAVTVGSSAWISIGQRVYVAGGGYYTVTAKGSTTTATLRNDGSTGNAISGATINAGASVSAAGLDGVSTAASVATWKDPVDYCALAALPAYTYAAGVYTASANGALGTQDGNQIPAVGDAILLLAEADATKNQIVLVTAVGNAGAPFVLTQRSDLAATGALEYGSRLGVRKGIIFGGKSMRLNTAGVITVGTSNLAWIPNESSRLEIAALAPYLWWPMTAGSGVVLASNEPNAGTAGACTMVRNGGAGLYQVYRGESVLGLGAVRVGSVAVGCYMSVASALVPNNTNVAVSAIGCLASKNATSIAYSFVAGAAAVIEMGLTASNFPYAKWRTATSGLVTVTSAETAVRAGDPFHLATHYDGATIRVFLNGQDHAEGAATGNVSYAGAGQTHSLFNTTLGGGPSTSLWNGFLENVMIENQATNIDDLVKRWRRACALHRTALD